ncbi:MAG TPA: hypothetical protein VGS04_06360, partial [Nitrososphaerales archaeon]|nr:hypothetical protein [Nitrososphaerales archaeon]
MSLARGDRSLQEELDWAIERLAKAGYRVRSKVRLLVDPNLDIMGYASEEEGGIQHIVVAEWALQSEMLGGLLFHELSHVYFTEKGASSHDSEILEEVITELRERDGLRAKETEYLVDAFNHLQNVMVDDIVFAVMEGKEREMAKKFFGE